MPRAEPWVNVASSAGAKLGSLRPSRLSANMMVGSGQEPRSRAVESVLAAAVVVAAAADDAVAVAASEAASPATAATAVAAVTVTVCHR